MKLTLELPESMEGKDILPFQIEIVRAPSKKEHFSYVPTHKGMVANDDKRMLSSLESEGSTSEATTTKVGAEATTTKTSPK